MCAGIPFLLEIVLDLNKIIDEGAIYKFDITLFFIISSIYNTKYISMYIRTYICIVEEMNGVNLKVKSFN